MKKAILPAIGLMLAAITSSANAADLITNGNFETTTAKASEQLTPTDLPGWTSTGYNFLFLSSATSASGSTADTSGAVGSFGTIKLAGPGTGNPNGFTVSPSGGDFVAADDDYMQGPISQTLTNLTVGATYALSFNWAAAQQFGYKGTTQSQWTVTFGNQSQSTQQLSIGEQGFSGWKTAKMNFTASSVKQTLSFLASGSPGGNPPFALLDGVSLSLVAPAPEPATWALMIVGFGLVGASLRRRRVAAPALAM